LITISLNFGGGPGEHDRAATAGTQWFSVPAPDKDVAPVKRSRRLVILSAVSLAASVAAIVVAAPSASAAVAFTSTAVNRNGNNCMTVPGGSSANAVQLQQQACTSAASQNFTFNPVAGTTDTYNIATLTAGKCVDVNGASTADNATIIQWTCHSNNNQRWCNLDFCFFFNQKNREHTNDKRVEEGGHQRHNRRCGHSFRCLTVIFY